MTTTRGSAPSDEAVSMSSSKAVALAMTKAEAIVEAQKKAESWVDKITGEESPQAHHRDIIKNRM